MADKPKLGVILLNLGTPDEPSKGAIRRYLAEFLSDPRVVNLARWVWLPILYLIILNTRPAKLVEKYEYIWGRKDAPLRAITEALAKRSETALKNQLHSGQVVVRSAMTYGSPSVEKVVNQIEALGVESYLFLPLFPQYSSATVGACFNSIARAFKNKVTVPPSRFISGYHDRDNYIHALTKSIERYRWFQDDDTLLLFSFHGIPESQASLGDPYAVQCHRTAELVAHNLGLADHQWRLSYQSRFGPAPWLKPYTDQTLAGLPGEGINRVLVVCPGFATECLETLEEIKLLNRDIFLEAGGKAFRYVKALNATTCHVNLIRDLVNNHLYPIEQRR